MSDNTSTRVRTNLVGVQTGYFGLLPRLEHLAGSLQALYSAAATRLRDGSGREAEGSANLCSTLPEGQEDCDGGSGVAPEKGNCDPEGPVALGEVDLQMCGVHVP